MRIGFMGSVEFSEHALRLILELSNTEDVQLVGVVAKTKSKFNSDFVDIGKVARSAGVDVEKVHYYSNSKEAEEFLRKVKPDVIYCFGWSSILGKGILSIPKKGVIGFHPAKLPANRGRHPLVWALTLGLTETGSTFFQMDTDADSGPIISQKTVPIAPNEVARTLYDKVVAVAMEQIRVFTRELVADFEVLKVQNSSHANSWRKRTVEDGLIDWRMSADSIHNLVRALSEPYVGAIFMFEGHRYTVWATSVEDKEVAPNIEPGKILKKRKNRVLVKCAGLSSIWLVLVEPELIIENGDYL
jgi:methionyl-tRNA formyltransferase